MMRTSLITLFLMVGTLLSAQQSSILLKPSTRITEKVPAWPKELVNLYDTVRILFIGDVMQHGKQIKSAYIPGTDPDKESSYNYSHAFMHVRERFAGADLAVANMEFPVGLPPYSGYPQFSAPTSIVKEAVESGIGLFCIANNHLLDKGEAGIRQSLFIYDSLSTCRKERTRSIVGRSMENNARQYPSFHYTGAYANDSLEYVNNPKIINLKGVNVAFINFTYGTNGFAIPKPFVINLMDSIKVKDAIDRAKQRGAQMIVALPHWGNEYELYPSNRQKNWAKMLFRCGVQVIIGSHPHVPQTAELYLNKTLHPRRYGEIEKMVFYSLGNYISNQSIPDYSQLGMLVEIKIIKNNLSGEITLSRPNYEYLWCFKKDEFAPDYTVVPVKELINRRELVKSGMQYERMEATYNFILQQRLVKEIK